MWLIVGSEDKCALLEGCKEICDGINILQEGGFGGDGALAIYGSSRSGGGVDWRVCECDTEGRCVDSGKELACLLTNGASWRKFLTQTRGLLAG